MYTRTAWTRVGAAVAMVVIGAIGAAPASAATQLGETFVPDENCSPRIRLQTVSAEGRYTVPFAGIITSWSFRSSSAAGGSPMKLKVARSAGGGNFTIIGESTSQAIPDADALHTFPTHIAVQAGDVIGVYTAPASVFYCAREPVPGHVASQGPFAEDTAVGMTAPFTPLVGEVQLGVSALLEEDCDEDGLADDTEDGDLLACDSSAPTTSIIRGPKDKTRKKRATFEFTGTDSRAVASFQCSVDGAPFVACTSPHTVKVKRGRHTFSVQAIDQAGNVGGAAADDWKVKRKRKRRR